jgi:glucosyl-dolichyl phosphate glucuronosyltransferase
MKITVILCTYNRCRDLANVMQSLAASQLPASVEWEVLVVDNNSIDQTRDVFNEVSARFPGKFRYVLESQPGKSFALNTGIREATGDVLAFTDDDVTVDPMWLQNLTSALNSTEWAGTGGRTLPAEPISFPRWMSPKLAGILCAHFDLGDAPLALDIPPYGVNMAFRRPLFEKYGGFRTDMGPSPIRDIPRPNEDTEFGRRLIAAGERLRYEPGAIVLHPVLKDRINREYFLAWWFDFGRAAIRESELKPPVWGIPRRYFSMFRYAAVRIPASALLWLFNFNPQQRFWHKCWTWKMLGDLTELYRHPASTTKMGENPIEKRVE